MSHCWMRSKLNCFITGVVNWDMSEKQRKLCPIFYKGFNVLKKNICPTMFHKTLMENVTI